MVKAEFTVQQAALALYGDDQLKKLQDAYHIVQTSDRSTYLTETLPIFAGPNAPGVTARVTIRATAVPMLVPEKGRADMQAAMAFAPMAKALREAYDQHDRFEIVRKVVRWLNSYATPGAARHYCPWMTSLLPDEHPLQKLDGNTFREPVMGTGGILPLARQCQDIIASALLVGDYHVTNAKDLFRVMFNGQRDGETYYSEPFALL